MPSGPSPRPPGRARPVWTRAAPADRRPHLGSRPHAVALERGRCLEYSDVMDPAVLKEQIAKGEYRVDTTAVADALLRRLQNVCSYPVSGPSASVYTTPGGPSTTDPIQVMLLRLLAPRGGTQAHNS